MDYKKSPAARTTVTRNLNEVDAPTENIYEALVMIARRADQINDEIREELHEKLEEFATHSENLEEIFENKEQIEVSRFYESLPKPAALAMQEWMEKNVHVRYPEDVKKIF